MPSALIQILPGGKAPNYSQLLTHNYTLLVVISSKKNIGGVSASCVCLCASVVCCRSGTSSCDLLP